MYLLVLGLPTLLRVGPLCRTCPTGILLIEHFGDPWSCSMQLQPCVKELNTSQLNRLSSSLKRLEKGEENKLNVKRRKEIVNLRM